MMKNPIIQFYKQLDKFIERSADCYLYDSEGKQYIDFESGDWAAFLGHSNHNINQVIKRQVDVLIHDGLRFRNRLPEELAIRIIEKLCFENGQCVFLNSGSEAVNLSIVLAKSTTGRNKILKLDYSYLSAFGYGQITNQNTNLLSIPENDSLKNINFQEVAAFVFEAGSSWGLIKLPQNNKIRQIAGMVKKTGGLLIANEVTTGFGRTGKWFGFQHYDYLPDIVAMGKILGNGYPVSCVAVNENIANIFEKNPFRYAQSHQNDPIGCAVGLEVIRQLSESGLIEQGARIGLYFKEQLQKLKSKYADYIEEVRGRGLMLGLKFFPIIDCEKLYLYLIQEGFLVGCKENLLRFMPPVIILQSHIDELIRAIDEFLGR